MNIEELKQKPLWQMNGEEFLFLQQCSPVTQLQQPRTTVDTTTKYTYGISGLAELFSCSVATANRIKRSKKIDGAITQIGRKIVVDVQLALELAGRKNGGRK